MSYYFVEAEDKSFVNFKAYDTCTEAQKRSLELAELLDTPVCVFKSFSYPQNRDDAFLRWTAYPDNKLKFAQEDIGDAFDKQSEEMIKTLTKNGVLL
jgi:hypothetical protein